MGTDSDKEQLKFLELEGLLFNQPWSAQRLSRAEISGRAPKVAPLTDPPAHIGNGTRGFSKASGKPMLRRRVWNASSSCEIQVANRPPPIRD